MKYPKITALAPKGEEFKEEAVNEGIWLTAAHMTSIETKISGDETAAATAVTDLNSANSAKKVAEDALVTATATIEANKTEIANLKAEVAKLKKEPAGDITSTTKVKDDAVVTTGTDAKSKYHTSFDDVAAQYTKK